MAAQAVYYRLYKPILYGYFCDIREKELIDMQRQSKTTNLADVVVLLVRIYFGFKQVHIYNIARAV